MSRATSVGSAAFNAANVLNRNVCDFIEGRTPTLIAPTNTSPKFLRAVLDAKRNFQGARQSQLASGVSPGTTVETLDRTFEEATATSNRLNEERFQEGRQLFAQQKENVAQLGASERTRLVRSVNQANAAVDQSLISRGLFNPVTAASLKRANVEDFNRASLEIEESLLRERNRVLGEEIGFIERRTDAAIDPALFAQLQRDASGAITGTPSLGGGGGGGGGGAGDIAGTGATDFAGRSVFNTISQPKRQAEKPIPINPVTFIDTRTGGEIVVETNQDLAAAKKRGNLVQRGSAAHQRFLQKQEQAARDSQPFDIRNTRTGNVFQAPRKDLKKFENNPTFLIIGPSSINR